MIKMRKILAIIVAVGAGGIFCSIESVDDKNSSVSSSNGKIWSTLEASTGDSPSVEGIYAMQGSDYSSDVEYDQVIPINVNVGNDLYDKALEDNMYQLDSAMEESREIMRSLNIQSAEYIDDIHTISPDVNQMNIEEFEMQRMMPEKQGISKLSKNQVISEVDIVMPRGRAARNMRVENQAPVVISTATMKVVDVLLQHGEDARALSMIEHALLGTKLN